MSKEGEHDKGVDLATEAMDEAEKLLEVFAATPWKKGCMAMQEDCTKVTCLARHVLATELQFQGAPAFAVEELMQSASDLSAKMGKCAERELSSANSERYIARVNSAPAKTEEKKAAPARTEPLLIRAATDARAQLKRAPPKPSGAPGPPGYYDEEGKQSPGHSGKKKGDSAQAAAGEAGATRERDPFKSFKSTSTRPLSRPLYPTVERRDQLLTDDGRKTSMDLLRVAYDQLYLPTILEARPDASQNPVNKMCKELYRTHIKLPFSELEGGIRESQAPRKTNMSRATKIQGGPKQTLR